MATATWIDGPPDFDDHESSQDRRLNQILTDATSRACEEYGISFGSMSPIQRMFATHYRCNCCKMLPLYKLDLSSTRRAKCSLCGHHVPLKNSGKYGKVRKQVAKVLSVELIG